VLLLSRAVGLATLLDCIGNADQSFCRLANNSACGFDNFWCGSYRHHSGDLLWKKIESVHNIHCGAPSGDWIMRRAPDRDEAT
jgi:hypothetical protein